MGLVYYIIMKQKKLPDKETTITNTHSTSYDFCVLYDITKFLSFFIGICYNQTLRSKKVPNQQAPGQKGGKLN